MECTCLLMIGISTIGICLCMLVTGNQNSEATISKVTSIQGSVDHRRPTWTVQDSPFNLFSVKNTVQVQGGLMNLFSGQSALQHEFGYNLGRFMSKLETFCEVRNNGFRFGNNSRIIHRNTNTSIQRCLESTNGAFRVGFKTVLPELMGRDPRTQIFGPWIPGWE